MLILANIFWLGTKELRSVLSDIVLLPLIIWSFSFAIYEQASSMGETVNNASIAFVDEDRSSLSRQLRGALYPPYFQHPQLISASDIDESMDQNRFLFVVVIPPAFEADVRKGRRPAIQINIDATAVEQASLGIGYLQQMFLSEVNRYAARFDETFDPPIDLVIRRAFNPNGTQSWFQAIVSLLDQLSIVIIVLTGAALIREREHGTIEHLLVMPLTPFQIVMAKVWANGLIVLIAFSLSMTFIVEGSLGVPVAGSRVLLVSGTALYLFAAAAIGIFLGTIARTMGQLSLLLMMVIIMTIMLSGGMTPIESQPETIQNITFFLPSRHYISFAQAVVFRGAGIDIVWPQVLMIACLGLVFFTASLTLFRRSVTVGK